MTTPERIYRRLLRVYPAEFRREYAEPMAQLFADQLRDAHRASARAGWLRLWIRTVLDVFTSALAQHLERDRTMAHSTAPAPSFPARALGIAGVLAGAVLIVPYLVTIDDTWFPPRIILFNAFVIAVTAGLFRRQAAASPRLAGWATAVVILANAWYLGMVMLGVGDVNPFGAGLGLVWLVSGISLWAAAAVYGAASLAIGAFRRFGPALLLIGSVLAVTGIDRFGLAGADSIFGPLSQVGGVMHGLGWIVMGVELALSAPTRPVPAQRA